MDARSVQELTAPKARLSIVGVRGHGRFLFAGLLVFACSRERGKAQPGAGEEPGLDHASRAPSGSSILFGPERVTPQARVNIGPVEESEGRVSNADRVVAGMRAGIRACYRRGLVTNPAQRGDFRVRVAVGSEGQVVRSTVEGANGLSRESIDCIVRRVESSSFARPDESSASFSFLVQLEPVSSD